MKNTILNRIRLRVFKGAYYVNNKMDYAFYWGIFNSMEVELFMGTWTTLKVLKKFTFLSIISTLILIALVLNYIVYFVVIAYGYLDFFLPQYRQKLSKYKEKVYRRKNENFLGIFDGVKPKSIVGVLVFALIALRDLTLPIILIYGVESAYL